MFKRSRVEMFVTKCTSRHEGVCSAGQKMAGKIEKCSILVTTVLKQSKMAVWSQKKRTTNKALCSRDGLKDGDRCGPTGPVPSRGLDFDSP